MSRGTRILGALRRRTAQQRGFTLVELLVVMLILGILAAIAMALLLNQREKADDASAKSNARTLMTAMETCGGDNSGSYAPCDIAALRALDGAIPQSGSSVDAESTAKTWTVTAVSAGGNSFQIVRNDDGSLDRPCDVPSGNERGGCPPGDTW